ncbi:TetR/AcrR family transcriptional regulator [Peribacillus loiseleuriae]|uniref:TetR/AcrR family transcriptional regulator n=1 Tax=Peribacillus loiseleuriae TaxID=1679170 RepID=UPI003D029225
MSDHPIDRRIIRTKRMIRDALTELMEEKGFDGITVRDLTEKADINRGTFYLHYRDKYDLLEKSENEIFQELEDLPKEVQQLTSNDTIELINQAEPIPFAVKLFERLLGHSSFMKMILGPKGDPSFQVKLKEVMRKNMLEHIVTKLNKEEMMVPVDYILAYVSAAHLGVIQHWLNTGMEQSPREMALILSKMALLGPANVAGIIRNFPSNN